MSDHNAHDLKLYFAWLVRESFRQQVKRIPLDITEVFAVGLNYWDWRDYAPDTLLDCHVLLVPSSNHEISLLVSREDLDRS